MGLCRRIARSRKGMATIMGGLFFIILVLLSFNVMLWTYTQQDAYNTVNASMSDRDQQALSEKLVPLKPGAQNVTSSFFNIPVNNAGSTTVTIVRIYVTGVSGASQCTGANAPCIVDPSPASGASFLNANVPAGATHRLIPVNGLNINDGGTYKLVIATSRGRAYGFSYPWGSSQIVINNANQKTLNIGPIQVYIDFNSFNFTRGTQTQSQPAWIMPSKTQIILWVKIANVAPDPVTIAVQSGVLLEQYTGSNAGNTALFIVNSNSVCPNPTGSPPSCQGITAFTPITLPGATAAGPSPPVILKFSATVQGGTTAQSLSQDGTYLAFMGMFYYLNGQFQGETVPFIASNLCITYVYPNPSAC